MVTASALIPVRSKRQAMDWSLVLASQDIQCTILPPDAEHSWSLLVAAADHARALAAIDQYRRENRGWAWRDRLAEIPVEFQWSSLVWGLVLVVFHGLSARGLPDLRGAGAMDNLAVSAGQWWRLFTAILLHADVGHLMANLSSGALVWGLAMGRFGAGPALLAAFLAGAGGNATGWLLYPEPYRGVGASGMVMGGLGLLTMQSFSVWRTSPAAARLILSGVCAGVLLFVLLGLNPASDVVAHLGGFVFGLVFGAALARVHQAALTQPVVNLGCGLALGVLVIATWWFALR
jgi:membrane associated rhomboid family serine protease